MEYLYYLEDEGVGNMATILKYRRARKAKPKSFWQVIDEEDLANLCGLNCDEANKIFIAARCIEYVASDGRPFISPISLGQVMNWCTVMKYVDPIEAAKMTIMPHIILYSQEKNDMIVPILESIFNSNE